MPQGLAAPALKVNSTLLCRNRQSCHTCTYLSRAVPHGGGLMYRAIHNGLAIYSRVYTLCVLSLVAAP